jgi:adenosylcobinamide kinase/adenosylcobinamide-phosphate guanylyltransferase
MRLRLLGTGASDGWPNPWCRCPSCRAALAEGVIRGQTSALLDDRLLLDLGPDGPRAALRQGVSLAGVEAVLVTHGHPDHHAVPAWRWHGWAAPPPPLTLVAPPAVIGAARPRLDDAVQAVEVTAGASLRVAGYDVRVLPAAHADASVGPAVLYDVTGPDGVRVLWGTDTGPLPDEAVALAQGRRYDALLLELTGGHLGSGHLDLAAWPGQLTRLREVAAIDHRTRLLAIHLGHGNPPPRALDERLAEWGAVAPRDGDVLELAPR